MYLSFICRVDRKNLDADGGVTYILEVMKFDAVTSWEEEQDFASELMQARFHAQIVDQKTGRAAIARVRDNFDDLVEAEVFDLSRGAVKLWRPNGPMTEVYVTLVVGELGLGQAENAVNSSLMSEHLYIQFDVDVGFSRTEDNPNLRRPVTIQMFNSGTRMYVPQLPPVSLVRRRGSGY